MECCWCGREDEEAEEKEVGANGDAYMTVAELIKQENERRAGQL